MAWVRFLFRSRIAASLRMFLLGIFSIFAFARDRVMDIFVVRGNAGSFKLFLILGTSRGQN